jgi:hypothetical protein
MNDKYSNGNIYTKVVLFVLLLVYVIASINLMSNPCTINTVENCNLSGHIGLSYVVVWGVMCFASIYLIYLAITSIKYGVYPHERALVFYRTKLITGPKLYVYCFGFILVAVLFILFSIVLWESLEDTISQYNLLNKYN